MSDTVLVEVAHGGVPDSPDVRAVVEKMAISALGPGWIALRTERALCIPLGVWRYNVTCIQEAKPDGPPA